jgi:hypothetical protein
MRWCILIGLFILSERCRSHLYIIQKTGGSRVRVISTTTLTLYILEKHPPTTALGHKTSLLAVLHSLRLRQDEKRNYNNNNNANMVDGSYVKLLLFSKGPLPQAISQASCNFFAASLDLLDQAVRENRNS